MTDEASEFVEGLRYVEFEQWELLSQPWNGNKWQRYQDSVCSIHIINNGTHCSLIVIVFCFFSVLYGSLIFRLQLMLLYMDRCFCRWHRSSNTLYIMFYVSSIWYIYWWATFTITHVYRYVALNMPCKSVCASVRPPVSPGPICFVLSHITFLT